jgi:hypothetical protein
MEETVMCPICLIKNTADIKQSGLETLKIDIDEYQKFSRDLKSVAKSAFIKWNTKDNMCSVVKCNSERAQLKKVLIPKITEQDIENHISNCLFSPKQKFPHLYENLKGKHESIQKRVIDVGNQLDILQQKSNELFCKRYMVPKTYSQILLKQNPLNIPSRAGINTDQNEREDFGENGGVNERENEGEHVGENVENDDDNVNNVERNNVTSEEVDIDAIEQKESKLEMQNSKIDSEIAEKEERERNLIDTGTKIITAMIKLASYKGNR